MMFKRAAILSIFLALFIGGSTVLATPYGKGSFGDCSYQTSCPAPENISQTPSGTPAPDVNPAPTIVASDIDNDGNNEQATDADGNPANGFEQFVDPDGSSTVLLTIDGEHDGTTGFIIDSNGDGKPDIYWSPNSQYVAPAKVEQRGEDIFWVYKNAKGSLESILVGHKKKASHHTVIATQTSSRITPSNFGGPVYQEVGQLAEQVPPVVAYTFPYLLLGLLLVLIGRLLLQARREFARMEIVTKASEREKQLALEKQNFLMAASHYFRTPIATIKNSIALAKSQNSIPQESVALLNDQVKAMQTEADSLLEKITNDQNLKNISKVQTMSKKPKNILLSPYIYVPLGGTLLLGVFANFVFVDFWVIQPSIINYIAQVLLVLILGQWFISSARKRYIHKQNRLDKQKVLEEERSLDAARSAFMADAARTLADEVETYDNKLSTLSASGHDVARFQKGFDQLKNTLSKFNFASSLQAAAIEMNKLQLNGADIVSSVTERAAPKASSKNITLLPKSEGGTFTQNHALLTTVLDSLTDNAIKFSPENAQVTMSQRNDGPNVHFAIQNSGSGMTKEQLNAVLKPFSPTKPAGAFNPEGGGFSVYLAQLIAHYLGGDITIQSVPNEYTVAELSIPRA